MNNKIEQLVRLLNEKMKLFLSISFGIFLFILFFQPFPIDRFDFNDSLLFIAGFGGIVFLFMLIVLVIFPWLFNYKNQNKNEFVSPSILRGFIILVFSSVTFVFYIKFVGFVTISFYIVFKVILICLSPPVILHLYSLNKKLQLENKSLKSEKKKIQKQVEKYEDEHSNKTIEFISENNTESLNLLISEVAFIKSADNYVEIIYKELDGFKKALIRNTLKNIEHLTKQYSIFIRCHRTCIVNMNFIEKLNKSYSNYSIIINGYEEQLPVSRQYLLKIKELIQYTY